MNGTWNLDSRPEDVTEDTPGPGDVLMYLPCVLRYRGEWRVGFYGGDGSWKTITAWPTMAEAMADWRDRDELARGGEDSWTDARPRGDV